MGLEYGNSSPEAEKYRAQAAAYRWKGIAGCFAIAAFVFVIMQFVSCIKTLDHE